MTIKGLLSLRFLAEAFVPVAELFYIRAGGIRGFLFVSSDKKLKGREDKNEMSCAAGRNGMVGVREQHQKRYCVADMPIKVICFILFFSFLISIPLFAQEHLFYKEVNLLGGYSRNDDWVNRTDMLYSSVGFEDYRRFSNDYGDFLTTDLQARLVYDSSESSNDAWALQLHNAWAQFNLGGGKKLTVGHFDPVFGLEPVLDTHGTILRTMIESNIGFDKDWGLGFKGFNSLFDYEAAVQLGSGMSIYHKDDNFLITTRISKPAGSNAQYGLSFAYGNVLETMGMNTFPRNDLMSDSAVTKKRIGLDGQYVYGPLLFKGEVAYGSNNHDEVAGFMAEADYTLPKHQNIELALQFQNWLNDIKDNGMNDTTISFCVSDKISEKVTIRLAYVKDLNRMEGMEDEKIILQFYFFGL